MTSKGKERIFRATIASLISSNLSGNDLEKLVHYLDSDSTFRYRLFDVLMEVSRSSQAQNEDSAYSDFQWEEASSSPAGSGGLVDLVLDALSRKRLPKRELRSLLSELNPQFALSQPEELTSRELVDHFLSISPTKARKNLLRRIGLDVEDDLYLGGISDRRRE